MSNLMLNGFVDHRDEEIAQMRRQMAQLDEALRIERIKNGAIESGVRELRAVLKPLYLALGKIYGLTDEMGIVEGSPDSGKWDVIKNRLAPRLREAVDILLLQGRMTRTQLASALKMDYSNCIKNVIGVLMRQGLLIENGKEITLKEL